MIEQNNSLKKINFNNVQKANYKLKKKITYLLDKANIQYYFINSEKLEKAKKAKAITVNGYRKRLDLETSEVRDYTHKEINNQHRVSGVQSSKRFENLVDCNTFKYFVTFTFDPLKFDRSDVVKTTKAMLKWLKYYSERIKDFKFIVVVETHASNNNYETKEYHFHGLFDGIPINNNGLALSYSGKVCCSWSKKKIVDKAYFEKTKNNHLNDFKELDGEKVYNINSWKHGFSTCTIIADMQKCRTYLKKYMTKEMNVTGLFKKNYFSSRNLNRPFSNTETCSSHFKPFNLDEEIKENIELDYFNNAVFNGYNQTYNCKKYVVNKNTLSKEEQIQNIVAGKQKRIKPNLDFEDFKNFAEYLKCDKELDVVFNN